jgi:hypothetical protein
LARGFKRLALLTGFPARQVYAHQLSFLGRGYAHKHLETRRFFRWQPSLIAHQPPASIRIILCSLLCALRCSRPYTAAIAALLITLLDVLSISRMIVDIFPVIDIPVVLVAWNYPGLSAEDMERRVNLISERSYSTVVNGIAVGR